MYSFKVCGDMPYCEYFPKDFDANKKYPVFFFLHGAGERGTDTEKYFVMGPLREVKCGADFPFIVVAPQCKENTWYDHGEAFDKLFCEYLENPFVDTSRIYLGGASMGGYGTWAFAMSHASRLAAIVPICGGGLLWNLGTLKNLPVWAFHCEGDPVVNLGESQRMIEALRKITNSDVRYTVYNSRSHDAWTETFKNPELYKWLLSKTLNKSE